MLRDRHETVHAIGSNSTAGWPVHASKSLDDEFAGGVSAEKEVTVFSGDVTIVMSGATATADRATFHQSSQTFELEGHVQLKATPPAK